ncbi:MAG TPA: DUF6544 family protein [Solirubrobacteraceae bacterium]|nr:DUF6544 family protein [Solirubrobacteraceae bacterium]
MTSGDSLPEPVRRYLAHAVPSGEAGAPGVKLTMSGRIKVGIWLPFTATQWCDGKSFLWRASVGLGPLRPLVVTDRYEGGKGSMSGKLAGRWTLFGQADSNVVRSAAGRTALEAVFAPRGLVPGRGYAWRAEGDDHIVASIEHPPEHVEVHLHIAADGRLLNAVAQRWGEITKGAFGYLPFGADMHEERRFGDLVIPSRVTAGWNYGTDGYNPFFKAMITAAGPA